MRGSLRALVSGALCAAVLALAGAAGATFNTVRLVSTGTDTDATVAYAGTSADGSKAFFTTTDKVVVADTDIRKDVYVRSAGTTTLVTPSTTAIVTYAGVSADGSTVFITTNEGIDPPDADGIKDIYSVNSGVYTLLTPATTAIMTFSGSSAGGSVVFFTTSESLDAGDADVLNDVYQRAGGTTTLLTPGTAVATTYDGASADGSHVIFSTTESLVAGDTDAVRDIYGRSGGTTTLLTPSTTNAVTYAGNSADGSKLFFTTIQKLDAVNDTDSLKDLYQGVAGVYTLLTPGTSLSPTDLTAVGNSADGSHAFFTTAESLDPGDADAAVDLYDRSGGTTALVTPGTAAAVVYDGSSSDGSHVFFNATDSLTAADTDSGLDDVYERTGGATNLVSQPGFGASGSVAPAAWGGASGDGGHVFFSSTEKLAGDDVDTLTDVYEGAFDTNAPTIVLSQAPNGSNGWFKTAPATLHAVGTDDYTITSLACTADGGATTLPNLNAASTVSSIAADVQVSADGDYTVACVATDAAHNASATSSTHLKLDTTPPEVTSSQTPDGSGGWFKLPPASMHLVATDALSIDTLTCTLDGSPAPLVNVAMISTAIVADLQAYAQGSHAVVCTVTDSAGNSMMKPMPPIKLDAVAPVVTFSQAPNGTNGWFKTAPAKVRVTATDTLELATLICTLDGSPFTLTNKVMTSLSIAGDVSTSIPGDHAVVCTGTDTAGNAMVPPTQRLKLDTTAPTLAVANMTVDATGPTGATVSTYTTSASDATSSPATVVCTPAVPKVFPMGDTKASCTATDQAGNAITKTFLVHVRTAVESIAVLKGMVTGATPPLGGVLTPILGALLDFASRYAADPKKKADVCGKLKEFTNRLAIEMAKSKPGMTAAQASSLTAYANTIKANLGC